MRLRPALDHVPTNRIPCGRCASWPDLHRMRHAGMLSSMRMNGTRVIALAARPSLLGALLVLGGCAATASPPEPNDNGEAKAGTQPAAVTLEDSTEGRSSLRVNRSL